MADDDSRPKHHDDGRDGFGRSARRLAWAWLALIVLMFATLGSTWSGAMTDDDSRPKHDDNGRGDFGRSVRRLAWAWLALIVLMLASLGSAYLRLGVGNLAVGLAIAAAKAAIVVWLFMELRHASPMTRIAAAAGLATLLLLMSLSLADYATRRAEPARWQQPQQISPLFDRQPKR